MSGSNYFNSSEIKKRKEKRKKEKEIKIKEKFNKMSFLDNISTKDNTTFNKDVLDTIKRILIDPSSTSTTSNIKDKNDFQNFNKKKLIEIIKSKLINIDDFLEEQDMTQNQLILQIKTSTLIPLNVLEQNKPVFQRILDKYYMLRMFSDIEKITNFDEAKNSSQFKIQASDKKFFDNIVKKGPRHRFVTYPINY
jgi:hypothetical protein